MPPGKEDFFREATLRICGSLEIEKALFSTLEYLQEHLPADGLHLYTYQAELGILSAVATAAAEGGQSVETRIPLSLTTRWRLEQGAYPSRMVLSDMSENDIGAAVALSLGLPPSSALVMIVGLEGQELGAVVVNARGPDRYTEEQAELLAQLNRPWAVALSNCLRYRELAKVKELLADDNRFLHSRLRSMAGEEIIGADFGLREVMELVREVAPLPSPVLLLGETGTGKEIIAGAIHNLSPRRKEPFIKVNCGSLPPSLLDSELFGHEKGSFTGALRQKRGLFERADKGTVFLDEVGELPAEAQVRLLRVLQEKEIQRVGGSGPIRLDLRIIAATHRDLGEMVARGEFRSDLYFRLRVFPVAIPPLRERRADIPVLVQHFIKKKMRELGRAGIPALAPGALDRLSEYQWPGNVRELENAVERALIISRIEALDFPDLSDIPPGRAVSLPLPDHEADLGLDGLITGHIRRVLALTKGRVQGRNGAARLLKVNPSTLRNKMKKLGISYGRRAGTHQGGEDDREPPGK